MKGANCEAEQPSTQTFWLLSNFCQFHTLTAKKSAWYMLVLCRFFDNNFYFSHYFCTGLSELFFFCLVWLHNGPKIFLFYIFNWNYFVTAILVVKLLPYSTFSAGKWIFRISRFSDLKTLCSWIWKEVTGKL